MKRMKIVRRIFTNIVSLAVLSMFTAACSGGSTSAPTTPEQLTVDIVRTHPFDKTAFTQGLELHEDQLLVGTGWWGESRIYYSTLSNEQSHSQQIASDQFGEGVTKTGDDVWQLTWKNGIAYKRDARTLEVVDTARYNGEGWGLCAFSNVVVMSDGSGTLSLRDPETFAEQQRVDIPETSQLNELECVTDDTGRRQVYANVYTTTDIYRIDLDTARLSAIIDASQVPNNAEVDSNNVLNGIAHIADTDRFLITGKRWPDLYEVRFVAKS